MAQVNLAIGEDNLKDLLMGNRENAMANLLENVFNAVLRAQAREPLNAEPYERNEDRTNYRFCSLDYGGILFRLEGEWIGI